MARSKTKKKKKHIFLWILLLIIALLVTYAAVVAKNGKELIEPAKTVVHDLNRIKSKGLNTDTDTIRTFTDDLKIFTEKAETFLQTKSVRMTRIVPRAAKLEDLALSGLALADKAIPELLEPLPDLLDTYSIKNIKTKDGYDIRPMLPYLDYAQQNLPLIRECLEFVLSIDDPLIDRFYPLDDIQATCSDILKDYDYISDFILFAKTFLGNGEDRAYFLGISNTAELRAGGGFLGSMSSVQIKDGILKLGDFAWWKYYLTSTVRGVTEVTDKEYDLFSYLMVYPRDASYDPDFTRMGKIWCDSFTRKTKIQANGAIGLTPAILQKLLKYVDHDITLSDGTIINGDNATKVLQYDLYYKYFYAGTTYSENNPISDEMFAEAANKSMQEITSDLSLKKILGYLEVFRDSAEDRTLMVWMRDEAEEEVVKKLGCSGALNYDPTAPEVGVFFSNKDANKMGMFFDMHVELSEPTKNADGSCTYDGSVVFESKMSDAELKKASSGIYGTMGGKLRGFVHLFAPAGGTIEILETSEDVKFKDDVYQGLQVKYLLGWYMKRNVPYEVKFRVTTAPGADAPLKVKCTPTIYQYTHPEE